MDARNISYDLRRKLSGLWLLASLGLSIFLLDALTDFQVLSGQWWLWVVQYIFETHTPPLPYTLYPVSGLLVGLLVPPVLGYGLRRHAAYGDARRASEKDIKGMGLRCPDGVVLGEFKNRLVMSNAARHSLVVAGTRSGKTQGIVIPTIFNYKGSIVIMDVKGELFDETAGYRSQMSDVYRVEWTSPDTARYNPLASKVLPDNPVEIEQRINNLATVLGPQGEDHWGASGQRMLAALMHLEVCDARFEGREALITSVAHWPGDTADFEGDDDLPPLTLKFLEARDRAIARKYPKSVVTEMATFGDMPSRERSGIISTFTTEMRAFLTAAVEQSLSACDFTAKSLVSGDRPSTLYIVTRAEDLAATASLTTSLLTNIVFSLVSRTKAEAEAGHSLLILLEEFSALRKTAAIAEAFDRGAGMKVQLMPVIQSFSQIEQRYSKEELSTFMNNTDWIVAFSQNDETTRSILERYVGKTTRRRESKSEQDRGSKSVSESYEGVPLIMAQDWGTIPFGEHRVLVKFNHTRPLFVKTPLAYDRIDFKEKMGLAPPEQSRPQEAGDNPKAEFGTLKLAKIGPVK